MRKKKSDKGDPIMSMSESYFDWKLNFKKENQSTNKNKDKTKASLGFSEGDFKEYLKKWKKDNLS